MSLHSEIHEQPDCLQRLLDTQKTMVDEIAREVRNRDISYAYIAARGTSENAARYANYLWGAVNGLTVALAAPSLFTYYNQPPQLRGAFVVGISQSGRSPDIVSVLAEGKRQGCRTLAITNDVDSPLARTADFVFDIDAGIENAVAATKTYTSELLSIAMLSTAMSGEKKRWEQLEKIPEWTRRVLDDESVHRNLVEQYRSISSCIVLGRGFNFATAHEWALKLKELPSIDAYPYSSADFLHGPIAAVNGGSSVFAVVPMGAVSSSVIPVLRKLKFERQTKLLVVSNMTDAFELTDAVLALPSDIPEWISPVISIVPGQLFCYHLARARGCDTESPRGIHKVTETR